MTEVYRNMKKFDNTALPLTQAASAFAALGSEQRLAILQTLNLCRWRLRKIKSI